MRSMHRNPVNHLMTLRAWPGKRTLQLPSDSDLAYTQSCRLAIQHCTLQTTDAHPRRSPHLADARTPSLPPTRTAYSLWLNVRQRSCPSLLNTRWLGWKDFCDSSFLRRLFSILAQHSPCNFSAFLFFAYGTASVGARDLGTCVYYGQHLAHLELLFLAASWPCPEDTHRIPQSVS